MFRNAEMPAIDRFYPSKTFEPMYSKIKKESNNISNI